jgi:hypothetical protein
MTTSKPARRLAMGAALMLLIALTDASPPTK